MSEYNRELQIYGPRGTKRNLELLEKIYGRFKLKYKVHEISGKLIDEPDFIVESMQMNHGVLTNAYFLQIKDKLRIKKEKLEKLHLPNSPLISNLQKGKDIIHPTTKKKIKAKDLTYLEKGKKIAIILDTADNPNTLKIANGADLLICESSFLSDSENGERLAKEYKHLTAKQAGNIAKKSKAKKLILTHLSQRYDKKDSQILKEAKKVFKNTSVAKDFDRIRI